MALPATVATTYTWSDQKNNFHGPFEFSFKSVRQRHGNSSRIFGHTGGAAPNWQVLNQAILMRQSEVLGIDFWIRTVGSPGDSVEVAIQAFNNAPTPVPNGVDLVVSQTVPASDLTGSFQKVHFKFDPTVLTTVTTAKYCFLLRRTGSLDGTNYYEAEYASLYPTYLDGQLDGYTGTNWVGIQSSVGNDAALHFQAYFTPMAQPELWAYFINKSANTIRAHRSVDGGHTWLNGGGVEPATSATANEKWVHAVPNDPDYPTEMLLFLTNALGTGMQVTSHSLVSRAFNGLSGAGGPDPSNFSTAGVAALFIDRLKDGRYICFHQGAVEVVSMTNRRRVKYSIWDSGWSSLNVDVGGLGGAVDFDARAIVCSDDRAHFFYTDTTNSDLKHRTLNTSLALGTIQDIDTSILNATYVCGQPLAKPPAQSSPEIIIPYLDSDGSLRVARATSADVPTWATEAVSPAATTDPEATSSNCGAVIHADAEGRLYVFWHDDTTNDLFYDHDGGAGTWGTDTEWRDAITGAGINLAWLPETNGIGILYLNTNPIFDIFPFPRPCTQPNQGMLGTVEIT